VARGYLPNAFDVEMNFGSLLSHNRQIALAGLLAIACLQLCPLAVYGQNSGTAPVFNKAIQGQKATQPEGTLLNVVNWIGNVVCPLLAVGAIVMAIVSYTQGRGAGRWAVTAVGLLMISGLTRLIESWITSGTGGVQ
jgi:hypothetical protein